MLDFEKAINHDKISEMSLSELKAVNDMFKGTVFHKPKNTISGDNIESLMSQYYDKGGIVYRLTDSVVGYGDLVMVADGYKSTVILEHYKNEWSSYHTIKQYNQLPKKYDDMITDGRFIDEEGF